MGILSGLSNLGLGKLEGADLYAKEEQKAPVEAKPEQKKEAVVNEKDFIYEKAIECVCCRKPFNAFIIKTGKARLVKQDRDLRPVFAGIDTLKYDVISCPKCGYSATTKFYGALAAPQIKLIQTNLSSSFHKYTKSSDVVSYDEALDRYRLALASCIVKKGKDSEKAYTCLRMAWTVRGKAEYLSPNLENYNQMIEDLKDDEAELLHNALEGFVSAKQTESYPIAGMDETTLDYLLAVLYMKDNDYDNASRLIASVITSRVANERIKDKARELKEEILEKKKKLQ